MRLYIIRNPLLVKPRHLGYNEDEFGILACAEPTMSSTPFHRQERADTCVLACARMVLHAQTGTDPGEEPLREQARQLGIYAEERGTNLFRVRRLLEETPHVEARYVLQATRRDLERALARGDSVIVGVNASALYPDLPLARTRHAVVVLEIHRIARGRVVVCVNDPSPVHAQGMLEVDWADFARAWRDSGNLMVVVRRRKDERKTPTR